MTEPVVPAEAPEPCLVCGIEWVEDDDILGRWHHGPYAPKGDECPLWQAILIRRSIAAYNRVVRQVRRAEELERENDGWRKTSRTLTSELQRLESLRPEVAALRAQVERLEASERGAAMLIERLVDNEECVYDHHGYCQTHRLGDPCEVNDGRKWLAARATPEGGAE